MEAILGVFAVVGLILFVKTLFARKPEAAPRPIRAWIEHDARADARCVHMVEHCVSYLVKTNPAATTSDVIATMRRALNDNGIENPTAFALLTESTIDQLRREPVKEIDPKHIDFLLG